MPAACFFSCAGFEPRAVFPHTEVQFGIALCIHELQLEEQSTRLTALQAKYEGGPCIGIQLDMWTDPHTHVAYAGVNATTVVEPKIFTAGSTGSAKALPPQLYLQSEVLEFEVFPHTQHTGDNIKEWLQGLLHKKRITFPAISGVTPDGAADGQCGLGKIEGLAEKVDTCHLHGLQRSVLYSVGYAGTAANSNTEAKRLLRQHNRLAQLKNQVRAVSDGVRAKQVEAGVPLSKILTTVDTSTTRWGNQFEQVARSCVLRPVIDSVVDTYKRENRGKKVALVEEGEPTEADPSGKVGNAVAPSQVGLSIDDWDQSVEIEAFLDHPYQIKQSVEHKGYVTGATSLFLMSDLIKGCDSDKPLTVKLHPSTAKLPDRVRTEETRKAEDLDEVTMKARTILSEQLKGRFFGERPSNTRLVQIWMSKQRLASKWLPPAWHSIAKGLYLNMLRSAAGSAGVGMHLSPRKTQKVSDSNSSSLVRNLSDEEDDESPSPGADFDAVTDEVTRWTNLDKGTIRDFKDKEGILNEFALMYKVRNSFPLHFTVFKQVSSHLPHEGNSEQLFSRAGDLSDDNGKQDPARLSVWTSIGVNRKVFEPHYMKIFERYLLKFGKGGTVHHDDVGLLDPEGGIEHNDGYFAVQSE